MTERLSRRRFFTVSAGLAAAGAALGPTGLAPAAHTGRRAKHPGDEHRGACSVASWNGAPATARAMEMLARGADPADAVVAGVNIVEDDPDDMTVGLGGLPNEEGVVELDASVMHGPMHTAGSVASLRGIRNPSSVALLVMRRTDHVMLVGEGALRFARAHGFQEENLLTERARRRWLRWKENLSDRDNWLGDAQRDTRNGPGGDNGDDPPSTGTINCLARTEQGDLAGVTTTSGLAWKIPGRVGDSPIIGAGLYVDNDVGAAGATGRGEAAIQNCGSYAVVEAMRRGMTPTEACLEVLRNVARRTRERRLLNDRAEPNFNLVFYAVRKDGAFGSACMHAGRNFTVHDGQRGHTFPCAYVFGSDD